MPDKAFIFAKTNVDQYITEFHPAGKRANFPVAIGAVQLPQNDHIPWPGWQIFKTPQEALQALKEHVNYFKINYPNNTNLDEESDFAVYEIEVSDWDQDVYTDPYWEYVEGKINYHLHNPATILRKLT